ncbi:MAG: polymorphic toxin-type HINT domain-containing protein [Bernardetiaceae bacterium]|nr:polymorphic toxin-type HINT domain-containing protein [Bernardetiaceae bacterium]
MSDPLEYVIKGALMECSQGAVPALFNATNNLTTNIQNLLVAIETDKAPLVNIPSFTVCKLTQKPCVPAPTVWQQPFPVRVHDQRTLVARSCIACSVGGTVSFITSGQIPLPPEMQAELEATQNQVAEEAEQEANSVGEAGFLEGMIPIWGSGRDLIHSIQTGNGVGIALNAGFLIWDVASVVAGAFTFGAATAAMMGAKTGVKAALKAGAKVAAKGMAKQMAAAAAATAALKKGLNQLSIKTLKTCVTACFPAGTPVAAARGLRPIEQMEVDDQVWAADEKTGAVALKAVTQVFARQADALVHLTIGGEALAATPEHPFFVNGEWKPAGDLTPGDLVMRQNRELAPVERVAFSYDPTPVFNLEVADYHTYFVGSLGTLVHNNASGYGDGVKKLAERWEDLGRYLHCFPKGTPVWTTDGPVPVEQVPLGAAVTAYDPAQGALVAQPVTAVYKSWTTQLTQLQLDGSQLFTTSTHQFWVEEAQAWLPAHQLRAGTHLRHLNGQRQKIEAVATLPRMIETYDLEVAGLHNYFVGPGLLTHNQTTPPPGGANEPGKLPKSIRESSLFTDRNKVQNYTFYEIVDKRTGKPIYVGQTIDFDSRYDTHIREKIKGQGFDPRHFEISIIERDKPMNSFQARAREQHYIAERGTKGIKLPNRHGHMIEIGNKINAIGRRKFNWLMQHIGCP